MKSNATKWLENEARKKLEELKKLEAYQDFIKLQMAVEYSKKLDERKEQQ